MLLDQLLQFITITTWGISLLAMSIYVSSMIWRGQFRQLLRVSTYIRFWVPISILLVVSLLNHSLTFVEPRTVGVVISLISASGNGYRSRPIQSGLHWLIPLMEEVVIYPTYWQTYTMSGKALEGNLRGNDSITARTADGQEVVLDASIIFRLDSQRTIQVHLEWQDHYIDGFIRPIVRGMVRSEVSQFTVNEVNSSKRKELEQELETKIELALDSKGFILDRFILRNIAFSPEYATSVERKQVAEQQKIQREYEAQQIENLAQGEARRVEILADAEAHRIEIEAAAQAQALALIGKSLSSNPDLVNYRYVEQLAPNMRVMVIPNEAPYFLPLRDLMTADDNNDNSDNSDNGAQSNPIINPVNPILPSSIPLPLIIPPLTNTLAITSTLTE